VDCESAYIPTGVITDQSFSPLLRSWSICWIFNFPMALSRGGFFLINLREFSNFHSKFRIGEFRACPMTSCRFFHSLDFFLANLKSHGMEWNGRLSYQQLLHHQHKLSLYITSIAMSDTLLHSSELHVHTLFPCFLFLNFFLRKSFACFLQSFSYRKRTEGLSFTFC
jgi:hypothetical protein